MPAPQQAPPAPLAFSQSNKIFTIDSRPRLAPFSIITPPVGGGFYVKLLYHGTEQAYLKLFVNAGSRFATKVALGEYDIVYATGERWLGIGHAIQGEPFWPSADRYRLNSTFSFTSNSDAMRVTYVGHDIELVEQRNGNLSKVPIRGTEFGDE